MKLFAVLFAVVSSLSSFAQASELARCYYRGYTPGDASLEVVLTENSLTGDAVLTYEAWPMFRTVSVVVTPLTMDDGTQITHAKSAGYEEFTMNRSLKKAYFKFFDGEIRAGLTTVELECN